MSTVFDVTTLDTQKGAIALAGGNVTSVEITTTLAVPTFSVEVPNSVTTVEVAVPGVQGPPGAKNLYAQTDDPSKKDGVTVWGEDEKGYVWIPLP